LAEPPPLPGEVIRYAYLWTHEADVGQEEGRKDRPCVVVLVMAHAGGVVEVVVAPISSRAPGREGEGVAIPARTRQRLGLRDAPCWIRLTDVNRFAWPGPDLRPVEGATKGEAAWRSGLLPAGLFEQVREIVVARARAG
jgi:hypothetical protein